KLWYDHGAAPSAAAYSYAMVPGVTESQMSSYVSGVPFAVLANTAGVHGVKDMSTGAAGIAFFDPDSIDLVKAHDRCLVFYRVDAGAMTLALTNPHPAPATVTLTLAGILTNVTGPVGVTHGPATTTLTFNTQDGETYVCSGDFNTSPSISSIADQEVQEDNATGTLPVRISDRETDPGSLVLSAGSSNQAVVADAGISLGGSGSNRTVTISPRPDSSGTATITITVSDGSLSASEQFLVTVTAVNDAPEITSPANTAAEEDMAYYYDVQADDADGDTLGYTLLVAPGGMSINPATGEISWLPDNGDVGDTVVSVRVEDDSAGTDVQTYTLTVTNTNDAPVVTDDAFTMAEDAVLSPPPRDGVLKNDGDDDDDPLSVALAYGVSHGSLACNADGSFTYEPDGDFFGADSFGYRAWDGTAYSADTASVVITVTNVNDTAIADHDNYDAYKNTVRNVDAPGVLANDTDADPDILEAVLATNAGEGSVVLDADGSFSYTPGADFVGDDTFTYTVWDGTVHSKPATVTVRVTGNRPPVAAADAYSVDEDSQLVVSAALGVLDNDSDPDGGALTAVLETGVSAGALSFNADGSLTYTPQPDSSGEFTFSYTACDTGLLCSDPAIVTITVNAINDAPHAAEDTYATDNRTELAVSAGEGVLDNDSDIDSDVLSAVLAEDVSSGTLMLDDDGSFTYTPEIGFVGDAVFAYRASDGGKTSKKATVTVTVSSGNGPPVLAPTGDQSANTGEDFEITIAATDPQGDAITYSLVNGPPGMEIVEATGELSWHPEEPDAGDHTVIVQAADIEAAADRDTFVVTVQLPTESADGTIPGNAPFSRACRDFTVAPNPVYRGAGGVYFSFTGGAGTDGRLVIRASTGDVVHDLSRAFENHAREQKTFVFGPWDLTDRSGRRVPPGTYLAVLKLTSRDDGTVTMLKAKVGVRAD
ncbi:MAG: tandem-95 repeat protein, partial [Chitinivibrionales bacterium]|nr:tandem-95 repeat protein [Chitinivibrionales bacterium]MBD3397042.1 tandem-95 repeat protein [Chitinivibrionales bacterium]